MGDYLQTTRIFMEQLKGNKLIKCILVTKIMLFLVQRRRKFLENLYNCQKVENYSLSSKFLPVVPMNFLFSWNYLENGLVPVMNQ